MSSPAREMAKYDTTLELFQHDLSIASKFVIVSWRSPSKWYRAAGTGRPRLEVLGSALGSWGKVPMDGAAGLMRTMKLALLLVSLFNLSW